jgi:AraC-like DNA-binding protein
MRGNIDAFTIVFQPGGVSARCPRSMIALMLQIAPKLHARIVRFEAALHRKAVAPSAHLTDIAHALGYHDQMHMVRDFNHLSGESPTAICSQLDMFVHPELLSVDRPGS